MPTKRSLLSTLSSDVAALVDAASAHVVAVAAHTRRPTSGVAIGGDLVITADHGLDRDGPVGVLHGGERRDAVVVGRDPAIDLALLRVSGLAAAPLTVTAPPLAGSLVVSVARTASGTVSAGLGVITSVGGPLRTSAGVVLPHIIRTDAALRPGTAGGALFDADGRFVGMTTPGLLRGLPVAIPAKQALETAEGLASNRPRKRGYLGVSVQSVQLGDQQRTSASGDRGLLVFALADDGAAKQAGVLVGDIIVRFNDQLIHDANGLQDALADVEPGTQAALALLRGTAVETMAITTGARH